MYVIIDKSFKTCQQGVKTLLAAFCVSHRTPAVVRDAGSICLWNRVSLDGSAFGR